MIYEFHAIQSFTAANLNRDDLGQPKELQFGGTRRARVSSQSWKRAMRGAFKQELGELRAATRTKRAVDEIVARIVAADASIDPKLALHRAAVVLESPPLKLSLKKVGDDDEATLKTGQLLFFRAQDLDALAGVARDFAEAIDRVKSTAGNPVDPETKNKAELPKDAQAVVKTALTSPGDAVDVSLFGRMVAEMPEASVDASCQVAHAIGTHTLAPEDDYYTAVDDLKPQDTEGADMIGVVEFNASCFYRYAVLDAEQLRKNLGVDTLDDPAVSSAVGAFTRAFAMSIPTGKQNTFAARNPPSSLLVVKREQGAWNLANAFVDPVDPTRGEGGVDAQSTNRMLAQFSTINAVYGRPGSSVEAAVLNTVELAEVPAEIDRVGSLAEIVEFIGGAA